MILLGLCVFTLAVVHVNGYWTGVRAQYKWAKAHKKNGWPWLGAKDGGTLTGWEFIKAYYLRPFGL